MQPDEDDTRAGIVLEGRVQGVGFRWWARREAQNLGLRGTVRNRSDGSVELHVAGASDSLDTFLALVRQGPPGALVTRVRSVSSRDVLPQNFTVLR